VSAAAATNEWEIERSTRVVVVARSLAALQVTLARRSCIGLSGQQPTTHSLTLNHSLTHSLKMMRVIRQLASTYARLSSERPYATNIATGGVLWCAGDVVSQKIEGASMSTLDWQRVRVMTTYGLCCAGPIYSWWYRFLDRKTAHMAGSTVRLIAAKVFADQVIFELPYLAFFFTATTLLSGDKLRDAKQKIQDEYVSTYIVDCAVWPLAQVLNFRFVAPKFQAAVVNVFSLSWISYLSYVQHRESPHHDREPQPPPPPPPPSAIANQSDIQTEQQQQHSINTTGTAPTADTTTP